MSVVVTYLEMRDRSWLQAATGGPPFELRALAEPCPPLNRFFYVEVGRAWSWIDRLPWSADDWQAWAARPELSTLVGWVDGNPIGYAELERQGTDTEVAYFGLLPQFVGRGYGSRFLTRVIERGWDDGAARLWLHTCTLDHPAALANYERRGFRQYKREMVPDADPVRSA